MKLRVLISLFALTLGCSSTPDPPDPNSKNLSGTDEQIFLGDTIEKNYDPHVIMKRAEAFFQKEEYPEAIIEYQHFLDMHRAHVLAPYAQYKLGESHFKMAKSVDRDPEPIKNALTTFQQLLKGYPGSKYEGDALSKIRDCKTWLADTHLFIGQFYYRRGSYLAAAHRFEEVLKEYSKMEAAPEALYFLALSYKELGANEWARENLVMLAEQYPEHKHQAASRKLLAKLNETLPPLQVAQPVTPSSNGPLPVGPSLDGNHATTYSPAALPSLNGNGKNGQSPPRSVKPVSAIRSMPTAAASPASTELCRLGTWC